LTFSTIGCFRRRACPKLNSWRPNSIGGFDKRIDRRYDNDLPLRPTNFNRGAFVQLSGTNPQALVRVGAVTEFDYLGDKVLHQVEEAEAP
jgi:hypothetical protein